MGFKESFSSAWERGKDTVTSGSRKVQLNIEMNDLMKKRQDLAAQLGASLYETVKNMPELCAGREVLIDGIAQIDAKRAAVQAELTQLEQDQAVQKAASMQYTCQNCGTTVMAGAQFCAGCGKPVADIIAETPVEYVPTDNEPAPAAPACPQCGGAVGSGDVFCGSCGFKLR